MKATIHDVAKRAGVSVATVSRVVNGNYPVKEPTRQRVQAAIDELEYVPNLQARELNTRHSSSVGIVAPNVQGLFFAEALDSVERCLRDRSYSLLLSCTSADPAQEADCVRALVRRNVSGIIVMAPSKENFEGGLYAGVAKRMPMVFVQGGLEVPNASYVLSDARKGTMDAISHLLWHGHQRILFVRGEDESFDPAEEAYRALMEEAGILNESYLLRVARGQGAEAVEDTAHALRRQLLRSDVSAIFCCNDLMAAGAINACRRLRKSVPKDISIMGFGNSALSRCTEPQLTTMDQNVEGIGVAAAKLLLEQMLNSAEGRRIVLAAELVERESTGPCRNM